MAREAIERKLLAQVARSMRRERTRLRLTQEEAAERAEINLRHFQKLENGEVNATLRTLARLSRAFEIDPGRLFEP